MDKTVKEEDIACDWQRVPTYVYTPNQQPKNLDYLEQELQVCWGYTFLWFAILCLAPVLWSLVTALIGHEKQTEAATTVPAAPWSTGRPSS